MSEKLSMQQELDTKLYSLIEIEKRRYKQKGLHLITAFLLWACFFIGFPIYGKVLWSYVHEFFGQNLKILYPTGMSLLHTAFMLTWYGLFSILYCQNNTVFEKWRVNKNGKWPWQKDKKEWEELKQKTYKCLALHHLVVFPIILLFDSLVTGLKYKTSLEQFPTIGEFFFQILFCMVCEDFGFFWSHYTLHHPKLYNNYHKKHHEYEQPYSITAEYSSLPEYILGNLIPSSLGIKLLGSRVHIFTAIAWMMWRTYTTAEVHSGYEIPFSPVRVFPLSGSSYFHNFHHSHNVGAYGSYFLFWDHFMKVDRDFQKYRYTENMKEIQNQMTEEKININTDSASSKKDE
ncbi:hypothetical protein ABPG72_007604 [Tetrahymena utriculariae]